MADLRVLGSSSVLDPNSPTALHSLQSNDGVNPNGDLVIDGAGNLYGTTQSGGGNSSGLVFKLSPATEIETVLHEFQGTDGANPYAGLIFDRAGNLYGTTYNGGALNNGTVFKLAPQPDGEWSETVLHSFKSADGNGPYTGLVFDTKGNLYSTTTLGGTYGNGVVFKLTHKSNETLIESALYIFQAGEGYNPSGTLVIDAAGNVYGTAAGGSGDCYISGCGVIFQITP